MKLVIKGSIFVGLLALLIYFLLTGDDFKPDEFRGKRVLVTGGSQNIGREIALYLAKFNAHIIVTARNEERLKEVVETCKKIGAKSAQYIVADMSDLNQTKMVVDKASKLLGGLDYLILNHAFLYANPDIWSGNEEQFQYLEESMRVNYMSFVYLSTYGTPYLKKSNGRLVVVSSLAGHVPAIQSAAYGATKAAINQFYSVLRLEMAAEMKKDFSITICLLGTIQTERNRWGKYKRKVNMQAHPLNATAEEILRGAAARKAYVFIPQWTVVSGILRAFATDYSDDLYLKLFWNK